MLDFHQLTQIPALHDIYILCGNPYLTFLSMADMMGTREVWDDVVSDLRSSHFSVPCDWDGHKDVVEHVKKAAVTAKKPAKYALKVYATGYAGRWVSCAAVGMRYQS